MWLGKNMAAKVAQTHMHDHVATCTHKHKQHTAYTKQKQKLHTNSHTQREQAKCLGHARLKPDVHMFFVRKHTQTYIYTYIHTYIHTYIQT